MTDDPRITFDGDWQQLWVSTLTRPWAALGLVPCGDIAVASFAERLVAAGQELGPKNVRLLNATGAIFADVQKTIDAVNAITSVGDLVVVALDAVGENPSVLPIVRALSGALLVVQLGHSRLSATQHAASVIGSGRILGSLVLE